MVVHMSYRLILLSVLCVASSESSLSNSRTLTLVSCSISSSRSVVSSLNAACEGGSQEGSNQENDAHQGFTVTCDGTCDWQIKEISPHISEPHRLA